MAKTKTVYVCSNCGADSPKWLGKCPNCGEWNTYVEEIVTKEPAVKRPVPGIMEGNKIRQGPRRRLGKRLFGLDRGRAGNRKIHLGLANRVGLDRLENPICLGRGEQSPVETPGGPIIA